MPNLEIVKPNLGKKQGEELAEGGEGVAKEKLVEEKEGLEGKIAEIEKGGPGTILEERRTKELLEETERKLEDTGNVEQEAKKPSFEEFKAQEEAKFQETLEEARKKKDEAYKDEDKKEMAA